MVVFLFLFGFYNRVLPQQAITAFISPALAGVSCLGLAVLYRNFVQRGG
jgi:hypothetical protein